MDGPARIVRKIINKFDHFTEPPTRHREFGRCQPGTPVDAGRKEINVFRQLWENETFEKCSISFKFKEGENFNHPDEIGTGIHTLSILRIKI